MRESKEGRKRLANVRAQGRDGPTLTSPIERFGRRRVLEPLSTGPLADVYRALDEATQREVVVKALRPTIPRSSPFAEKLAREAEILGRLHHQNIVRLLEVVTTEDSMWLVLEQIDGFTLEQVLEKAGRLALPAALALAIELSHALSHAHGRGIIHRRLLPSNVMVSRKGEVKLIGFGSALDEKSARRLELEGSFESAAYMAPEQILGEPLDARADVFAVGVLLYQLLSGARPFDGPDARTTGHRIRHEPAPSLRATVPDLPRTLDRLVLRCLEKNPDDRFPSAAALASSLETALRALTATPRADLLTYELVRIRLIGDAALPRPAPASPSLMREVGPKGSLRSTAIVHFVLLVLLLGGGALIQHRAQTTREVTATTGPLELRPQAAGSLRVVADPWAHVVVNGHYVDTTPFARPIPLPAGIHYVTLQHPNAPDERRVVRLAPGETVLLDVKMQVEGVSAATTN